METTHTLKCSCSSTQPHQALRLCQGCREQDGEGTRADLGDLDQAPIPCRHTEQEHRNTVSPADLLSVSGALSPFEKGCLMAKPLSMHLNHSPGSGCQAHISDKTEWDGTAFPRPRGCPADYSSLQVASSPSLEWQVGRKWPWAVPQCSLGCLKPPGHKWSDRTTPDCK